jgi:hypothetical protein
MDRDGDNEANDWNPYWPWGGTQHYDTGDGDDYDPELTHPWWDGWKLRARTHNT